MTPIAYAIITLGNTILTGVMSGWLIYFYLPPGGNALVAPGIFGLVVLISRISHVTANVLINRFAPRTASGWLWHLIGGALFMPALFILLWLPPHAKEPGANLLHLAVMLVTFNIASGLHQAGYEALLPAFAISEKEQDAISMWRMIFLLLGSILTALTGPLIQSLNYEQAIGMFAAGSAPFLIIPGLFLSRRLNSETHPHKQTPFFDSVKAAWAHPAFRAFAVSWALMWLATTFTFETLPYIVTEICRLGKAEAAYFYLTSLFVSLFGYRLATKLTERYGVKTTYRASLLAGAIAMPLLLFINERIPVPLLVQGVAWVALQTICLLGAKVSPGAITAQIIADDPGQQGALYAFGNLVDQLSSGLALAIIPLFMLFGYSMSDPLGPLGIRLLALAGGGFLLAAFFVFGNYKIIKEVLVN